MKPCRQCKEDFEPQYNTTQPTCSPACALQYTRAKTAAKAKYARAKAGKRNRQDLRELNQRDLRWQHKQTQKTFNRMRVLEELLWFKERGLAPTCISCGKANMDWCCGHHKTVGAQGGLRYSRENTFLQCNRYCNMGLSGNIEGNKSTRGYKVGLIERFGAEEGQRIIDLCAVDTKPIKWEWQKLDAARAIYNKKIRDLQKELEL
jgi:hypothetical protein